MKPYRVKITFYNINRGRYISVEFDNIGAARTFVSNAPVTCKNFTLTDADTGDFVETHRFDELPLNVPAQPVTKDVTESEPIGDIFDWLKDVQKPVAETVQPTPDSDTLSPTIDMCSDAQRRALFGVIITEYAHQKKMSVIDAQVWLKDSLIKRGMIKKSRTELSKADATTVIDAMCKHLKMEIGIPVPDDSAWQQDQVTIQP